MVYVDWYDAIEYANWLSERKGLKAVYAINKSEQDSLNLSEYDDKKWTVLTDTLANGYRLPTEAEWEFAAGGGMAGRDSVGYRKHRYAGNDTLDRVGWYR